MKRAAWPVLIAVTSALAACHRHPADSDVVTDVREPCDVQDPHRMLLWGDLHVHTSLSFDAWVYEVRAGPEDAWRFARGEAIDVPTAPGVTESVQLDRPLDFAAVTDHSEYLVEVQACIDPTSPAYATSFCADYRDAKATSIQRFGLGLTNADPERFPEICDVVDCGAGAKDVWSRVQDAAEDAYDRTSACTFTSFVAYEWSGATGVSNLHRNILFRNAIVPDLPVSYFEEPTPEGLWGKLEAECTDAGTGCDVLAIPHNPNYSNGNLFFSEFPDAASAERRARMEPLVEIYQHKGDSECIDGISGIVGAPDEACGFEKVRPADAEDCGDGTGSGGMALLGCVSRLDTVRGALLEGLKDELRLGVDPYALGIVASTDTHNGTPGRVDEASYRGHLGTVEGTADGRLGRPGLNPGGIVDGPGGLAAVWATSNTRDAVFDALRRREVYGTSGPRIAVRLFAGADVPAGLCGSSDLVAKADAAGVPMGGELKAADGAPRFVVSALQDPMGTPLQRIQIVKGWIDADGEARIDVVDVAGGDDGASVDLDTCAPAATGSSELCGEWVDPDFDPSRPAFYYARVLEDPTCRWSWRDCLAIPEDQRPETCSADDVPKTVQERAWTSPIWVR